MKSAHRGPRKQQSRPWDLKPQVFLVKAPSKSFSCWKCLFRTHKGGSLQLSWPKLFCLFLSGHCTDFVRNLIGHLCSFWIPETGISFLEMWKSERIHVLCRAMDCLRHWVTMTCSLSQDMKSWRVMLTAVTRNTKEGFLSIFSPGSVPIWATLLSPYAPKDPDKKHFDLKFLSYCRNPFNFLEGAKSWCWQEFRKKND